MDWVINNEQSENSYCRPRESGGPAIGSAIPVRAAYLYMMSDRYRGAIYTGVTSDIAARVFQHRTGDGSDFCRRYGLHRLVHVETTELILDAIAREKAIKKWRRAWKVELIERSNPEWLDLFETINC